jgi:hypothetical protein
MYVACVSSNRVANVPAMLEITAPAKLRWYVGSEADAAAYTAAGADVRFAGPLCAARNAALDDAFTKGVPCVQISDDLKRIQWLDDKRGVPGKSGFTKYPVKTMTFLHALGVLETVLEDGFMLTGVAATNNPGFYPGHPVSLNKFVVGDLFAAQPSEIRFDPAITLGEDYDYTCQHLQRYGQVARVNRVLATFAHRSNPGGAVDARRGNPDLERENKLRLMSKWPEWLVPNNNRSGNEILLRYTAPSAQASFAL